MTINDIIAGLAADTTDREIRGACRRALRARTGPAVYVVLRALVETDEITEADALSALASPYPLTHRV